MMKVMFFSLGFICLSFAVQAQAFLTQDHLEKRLMELQSMSHSGLDFSALTREASYEQARLGLDERAMNEALILLNSLHEATVKSFIEAQEKLGSATQARTQIEEQLKDQLPLLDPQMSGEIQDFVEFILENPHRSFALKDFVTRSLLEVMKKRSQANLQLLSIPPQELVGQKANPGAWSDVFKSFSDVPPRLYENVSTDDLVFSLSNDQILSERWVATANMSARSAATTLGITEFSSQVGVEFLGTKISAGPVLNFTNTITTSVDIKGEGHYPLFDHRGHFDLALRDGSGEIKMEAGAPKRRFAMFICDAESTIETTLKAGGELRTVLGGGSQYSGNYFRQGVNLSSRRVLVPDLIDGEVATVEKLAEICHRHFLNFRNSNGRTIRQNLETMARNLTQSLVYTNRNLECVMDSHCQDWFHTKVSWINRVKTTPRCIQTKSNDRLMVCQLRGDVGANCAVLKNGKRVSSGDFEYTCREGLSCVVTQEGGWFKRGVLYAPYEGECRAPTRSTRKR
jgi:hypothetical protein